jgi:hypothetical protein
VGIAREREFGFLCAMLVLTGQPGIDRYRLMLAG